MQIRFKKSFKFQVPGFKFSGTLASSCKRDSWNIRSIENSSRQTYTVLETWNLELET